MGKDRENEGTDIGGHVSDSKDKNDSEDHCHHERDGKVDRPQRRSSYAGTIDRNMTKTSILPEDREQETKNTKLTNATNSRKFAKTNATNEACILETSLNDPSESPTLYISEIERTNRIEQIERIERIE